MRISAAVLVLSAALGGCHYFDDPSRGPHAGNPNLMAYAGDPGSTYDRSANPPRDIGQVTYKPDGPLTNLPADAALPTPPPPTAVTTTPLAPLPPATTGNRARPPR
ncbi:MAG: hypothetical protein JO256_04640 [Alphaproteobacteria bacterium]|nr:hypothetical protein [Alphaproteobacteria bacterium]